MHSQASWHVHQLFESRSMALRFAPYSSEQSTQQPSRSEAIPTWSLNDERQAPALKSQSTESGSHAPTPSRSSSIKT